MGGRVAGGGRLRLPGLQRVPGLVRCSAGGSVCGSRVLSAGTGFCLRVPGSVRGSRVLSAGPGFCLLVPGSVCGSRVLSAGPGFCPRVPGSVRGSRVLSAGPGMVKLRARVLLLGDAAVGKSALCHTFQGEGVQFQKSYNMTAGVELVTKCVTIPESGHSVELYLVDSPGRDLLAEACEKMWGETWLLCLVFDLSSEQSFLSCASWLEKVKAHSLGNSVSGVLVGNKSDLLERRAVLSQEAQDWAQRHDLDYHETSAKELDTCMAPLLSLAHTGLSLYERSCERTLGLDT